MHTANLNKNNRKIALLAFCALALLPFLLGGCASTKKDEGDLSGTVGELYNNGMDQLDKKRYSQAIHTFDELQRQYPYSGWATRAEMMSAYASWKDKDYDAAIATADHFIKLHPGHPDLAYMYYLKGMAHYSGMVDVGRDQSNTQDAADAFEEVANRFPDSPYARDAKFKLTLCRDHLAGKEMEIGRYYQKRGAYLPAVNRFKKVVDDYQTTSQTPEALYRLVESYTALGIPDEAQKNAAVLGNNYPASPWYHRAYALVQNRANLPSGNVYTPWYTQIGRGVADVFRGQ